jgi:D-sedoheptulose 7-phosphate isomerase
MPAPAATPVDRVRATLAETARVHADAGVAASEATAVAAAAIETALRRGHKVLVCGNGGSAAEAQHFAAELAGRFARERASWPALALTTDTSTLTAIGNDYGFDRVFARQVEGLGQEGDVLLGISTSGDSTNVVEAFRAARARRVTVVAMTGRDGGRMGPLADIHVNVAHPVTARVQEVQLTLLHAICELVEDALTGEAAAGHPVAGSRQPTAMSMADGELPTAGSR